MSLNKIFYSPGYEVDIGNHVFPTRKYRMVKELLVERTSLGEDDFIQPRPLDSREVAEVHTTDYVNDIKNASLSYAKQVKLELPYSPELAEASFICCGGTVEACEYAMKNGAGVHIGGGFHHAYPDHGEGFCVFNDVALGALRAANKGKRVAVIDCDLHQGNGTAFIFRDDKRVFTFSIHQENNYPIPKEKSDLDIPLGDSAGGDEYNSKLSEGIRKMKEVFKPDFAVYVAGSDPYEYDQLGGLRLSVEDLRMRDTIVRRETVESGIDLAVVFAGGYAVKPEDTALIHAQTVDVVLNLT